MQASHNIVKHVQMVLLHEGSTENEVAAIGQTGLVIVVVVMEKWFLLKTVKYRKNMQDSLRSYE